MLLNRKIERPELLSYLYQFEKSYGDGLDNDELRFIFNNCEIGNYVDIVPYILTQFYNEYNLIDDNRNVYLSLLKKIKEVFTTEDKNILEIGGGPTPQLAKLLAPKSKSITVMDTSLSIKNNNYDNLYLNNKFFLPFTDISNYDLVIAYMACGANESILHNCAKNNKDFLLGLCPCSIDAFNEVTNSNLTEKEYLDVLINLAKTIVEENDMGTLKVDYLKDLPAYNFPIIYNKRVKKIQYKRDV